MTLVPIPFISVRAHLASDLLQQPKDPATLTLSLIREEPAQMVIDLASAKIIYKNHELDMMPARLALYAFFAMQKKACTRETGCRNCTECYLDFQGVANGQTDITDLYRKIASSRDVYEMSDSGIINLSAENFNSYNSKIRKDLEGGFGLYALSELAIESVGRRPDTRYGIKIDKNRIRITF